MRQDSKGRVKCADCGEWDGLSYWVVDEDGEVKVVCIFCRDRYESWS